MKKMAALLPVLALASAPVVAGEGPEDHLLPLSALQVGDQVRLHTSTGRVMGQLSGLDDAGLLIQGPARREPVRIPLEAVERLEVSRGKKRHAAAGAVIGFVPGALAVGYAMATFTCKDEPADCRGIDGWVSGAALGGGVTGAIGALIGLGIRTERWTPVAAGAHGRRPKLSLHFAPAPGGGVGVALSVSF